MCIDICFGVILVQPENIIKAPFQQVVLKMMETKAPKNIFFWGNSGDWMNLKSKKTVVKSDANEGTSTVKSTGG